MKALLFSLLIASTSCVYAQDDFWIADDVLMGRYDLKKNGTLEQALLLQELDDYHNSDNSVKLAPKASFMALQPLGFTLKELRAEQTGGAISDCQISLRMQRDDGKYFDYSYTIIIPELEEPSNLQHRKAIYSACDQARNAQSSRVEINEDEGVDKQELQQVSQGKGSKARQQ